MEYSREFFKEEANRIRDEIEKNVADGKDLVDYFTDNVYGSTEDGRWIIGYGVYGPAGHIIVCPTCVTVCGEDSEPFCRDAMVAMEEVMTILD